jgi:hypothetical protein
MAHDRAASAAENASARTASAMPAGSPFSPDNADMLLSPETIRRLPTGPIARKVQYFPGYVQFQASRDLP